MSAAPPPLERVSTVEALARALRRRILDGELVRGQRLREVETADVYEVGRYTVRAAFQDLVHGGMAQHLPNRGVSVADPEPEDVRDLYSFRAALEVETTRLVIERGLPTDRILEALARLEALPRDAPWSDVLEADLAMHRAIVDAAENVRISAAFGSIVDQVLLCLSTVTETNELVAADHRSLVGCLLSRDCEAAVRQVREHLQAAVEHIVTTGALASRQG